MTTGFIYLSIAVVSCLSGNETFCFGEDKEYDIFVPSSIMDFRRFRVSVYHVLPFHKTDSVRPHGKLLPRLNGNILVYS